MISYILLNQCSYFVCCKSKCRVHLLRVRARNRDCGTTVEKKKKSRTIKMIIITVRADKYINYRFLRAIYTQQVEREREPYTR